MSAGDLAPRDRDELAAFADELYAGRRAFLRERFEGYVADTYYFEPDGGYYCWPAQSDGVFEGFTATTDRESAVIARLEAAGYELLGVGASRLAFECPPELGSDLVVKFARCGMGDGYGGGREKILTEYQITQSVTDIPIVPCRHADPRGRFGLYPKARSVHAEDVSQRRLDSVVGRLSTAVPELDGEELAAEENVGQLDSGLAVLDYCEFGDREYPLGVPSHIDAQQVIAAVDRLRQAGEKLDIKEQGTVGVASIATD